MYDKFSSEPAALKFTVNIEVQVYNLEQPHRFS